MVDRPLFADPATGFADHYEAATSAVARALHDPDLPAPSMVWVTAESVGVYPWSKDHRPLSAMLAWAEHLADPAWSVQVRDWGTAVKASGRLYGVPCELSANTHRRPEGLPVDPTEVDIDVALIADLAAQEAR